jgi:hypothetical protein
VFPAPQIAGYETPCGGDDGRAFYSRSWATSAWRWEKSVSGMSFRTLRIQVPDGVYRLSVAGGHGKGSSVYYCSGDFTLRERYCTSSYGWKEGAERTLEVKVSDSRWLRRGSSLLGKVWVWGFLGCRLIEYEIL